MNTLSQETIVVDAADNLVISPLVEADRFDYVALRLKNDASLRAAYVFPWIDESELPKAFDYELERIQSGNCRSGIRQGGQLVGQIMLSEQWTGGGNRMLPALDLWIDEDHRRQGIAERSVRALAAVVFAANPGESHLSLPIGRRNMASKALASRLGAVRGRLQDGVTELWGLYRV